MLIYMVSFQIIKAKNVFVEIHSNQKNMFFIFFTKKQEVMGNRIIPLLKIVECLNAGPLSEECVAQELSYRS